MTGLDRLAKCRGCGKEIAFIKTEKGKTMPVDPEPVWVKQSAGGRPFIRKDGGYVYGYIAGDAEDDPDSNLIQAHVSHFATCEQADNFRNRRK